MNRWCSIANQVGSQPEIFTNIIELVNHPRRASIISNMPYIIDGIMLLFIGSILFFKLYPLKSVGIHKFYRLMQSIIHIFFRSS